MTFTLSGEIFAYIEIIGSDGLMVISNLKEVSCLSNTSPPFDEIISSFAKKKTSMVPYIAWNVV
jgi:hypothetical protein